MTVAWALAVLLAAGVTAPAEGVRTLENDALRVEVEPQSGALRVLDKRIGRLWEQPNTAAGVDAAIPRVAGVPRLNGDLAEWTKPPLVKLTPDMTADSKQVDDARDCSAEVWCAFDDACVYVAARVHDERKDFGPWDGIWWQRDSFEFWVGDTHVPIELDPAAARAAQGAEGLRAVVAVKPADDGYSLEVAVPWANLPAVPKPAPGARFRFAVGVNDADGTGAREGQLYFPASRRHANSSTFAWAALAGDGGTVPDAPPPAEAVFRNVKSGPREIAFDADLGKGEDRPDNTFRVSIRLAESTPEVELTLDAADPQKPIGPAPFLEAFLLDTPGAAAAMADYSNGHLYPLSEDPFPRPYRAVYDYDMPWVGICDVEKGFGYLMLVDTPEDADLAFEPARTNAGKRFVPRIIWQPEKGRLGYSRRVLLHFSDRGGYVALAKRYRAHAKEQGLLVTLAEKAKRNPKVERLIGAADSWGGEDNPAYARELKEAGVEKMLLQTGGRGKPSADQLKAIEELGYLSGQYDNYTDAMPSEDGTVDYQHDNMPANAPLDAQGNRVLGWITLEGQTFYKRCPMRWLPAAEGTIPRILAEQPFTSRFIDVTTAEGLYECYDDAHPVTRVQKREVGEQLLDYVAAQGLVVGGEHGKWWAVPHLDFLEGIMSAYWWFWPAGHLLKPTAKDQKFENVPVYPLYDWDTYAKWDIGHKYRAPLWELVFHDCVVTTWYWGDTNLWLHEVAPEVTPKKELFNLLYGTMPMFWLDDWQHRKELYLRTCRTVCTWHEAVAGTELVEHAFLSADRALQRSRFSNGAEVIVNFGAEPKTVTLGGREYRLAENGFAAQAPDIGLNRELRDGRPVTTVHTPTFHYTDAAGPGVALRRYGTDEVRVWIDAGPAPCPIPLKEVAPEWDLAQVAATDAAALTVVDGQLTVPPREAFTTLSLARGTR